MTRPNNSARRAPENLVVAADFNIGSLGAAEKALNISHDVDIVAGRNAFRQQIAISFSRAVTNLSFTITDIDTQISNQAQRTWSDRVELSPDVTSSSVPTGSGVIGRGRNETESANNRGPFRRTPNDNIDNIGDNAGNVSVGYAAVAANSPITLTFWTTLEDGNQRIFLSDFAFTSSTC